MTVCGVVSEPVYPELSTWEMLRQQTTSESRLAQWKWP